MKKIEVNGREIAVEHRVSTHEETHHVSVICKFSHGGKSIDHVLTIGAADEPLPLVYGKTELQRDLDAFKEHHARLFESKLRAAELAEGIE